MKKRITKKVLIEQVAQLEQQNRDYAIRMEKANVDLRIADHKLKRFEQIAGVRVDHLPHLSEPDFHEIIMRIDRHEWHEGGSRLLKEVVLNMFARMHRYFAADALPGLDQIEKDTNIKHFLGEWLRITTTCYQKHSNNPFVAPPLDFWFQVVTRFLDVIDQLKKAGKDSYKIKDRLIFDAYNNPIQLP